MAGFKEAFASARKKLGAGKTFQWNGKSYSTNTAPAASPSAPASSPKPRVKPAALNQADASRKANADASAKRSASAASRKATAADKVATATAKGKDNAAKLRAAKMKSSPIPKKRPVMK